MSQPCKFVWTELMTTDTAAAESFYRDVVGWGTESMGSPNGHEYKIFTVQGKGVSGFMKIPDEVCENGGRPGWVGYIGVDDADAYAERIKQAGGTIYRDPQDIPEVGRFAVCADPHGAIFMIIQPFWEAPVETPPANTPGLTGWHELHAGNGPEALEFYTGLFGWTKTESMDMGEHGVYQLISAGGTTMQDSMGAIMTKMPDTPAPFWTYYFNVPEINSAIDRIKENGGQIVMGPHEVPGGSWIVQALDPQGVFFSLVACPNQA